MWQAVRELGFNGGRVLEPGCGPGIYLGLAPAGAELTGVELDPTTAQIARALYPHAQTRAESFAATWLPVGPSPKKNKSPGARAMREHAQVQRTRPGRGWLPSIP
jgi:hypothetical protein